MCRGGVLVERAPLTIRGERVLEWRRCQVSGEIDFKGCMPGVLCCCLFFRGDAFTRDLSMHFTNPVPCSLIHRTCSDLARVSNDLVWYGGAIEGMATARVLGALVQANPCPFALDQQQAGEGQQQQQQQQQQGLLEPGMAEPKSAGECVITIITCVCVHVPHIQWRCFPLLWTCAYRQVDMFRHPAQLLRGCITVSCPSGYHLFPVRLLHAYMLIGTLVGMIKLRPHPYIHAPHPRNCSGNKGKDLPALVAFFSHLLSTHGQGRIHAPHQHNCSESTTQAPSVSPGLLLFLRLLCLTYSHTK